MEEKILNLLFEIRPECDFNQSSNFIEEGLLDSLGIVSLLVALEEEFAVSIGLEDVLPENFLNIERISQLLIKNNAKNEF